MGNSLISVIVPVYKAEKFLNRCVESIVNQTYRNLEIFLVDDGSPDLCPEFCDEWAKHDSRIKVLHIENGGVANARNTALKQASGDYIAFADSDDYLEPDMYEKLLCVMESSNADIVMCDYQVNDESRGEDTTEILSHDYVMQRICLGDYKFGVLWNKLYKKNVVNGLEMPALKYSEDLAFNFSVFSSVDRVAKCNLKLYHYYQNDDSAVHKSFSEAKYDTVQARKMIYGKVSDKLQPYALYGYMLSLFVFLNQIIISNQCIDMVDDIRDEILQYKNEIKKSSLFSKKDKIKIRLLSVGFTVYKAAFLKLG